MSEAIINGQTLEAEIGKSILDVARRNGSHMGFVCDGAGPLKLVFPWRDPATWLEDALKGGRS